MHRCLVLLLLATGVWACSSDPAGSQKEPRDAGDAGEAPITCLGDGDCPLGLACIAGDCRPRPDAGLVEPGPDASTGCLTDEECGDLRYACSLTAFRCVRVPGRCLDDADCEEGYRCDRARHQCLVSQDAGTEPPCLEGELRGCGTSKVGECRYGIQVCEGGAFGECFGAVEPSEEKCDRLDNDCDGTVDEGIDVSSDAHNCGQCGNACDFAHAASTCEQGRCRMGPCVQGWFDLNGDPSDGCEYACAPTNGGLEVCDSLDNDCDGVIDDGVCAPQVSCPGNQTVGPNADLTLVTNASSTTGRPITCAWSVVSRPATSNGQFTNTNCNSTRYFADVVGVHHLRFTVTDSAGASSSCDTQITVNALGDLWVELTWDRPNDMDLHLQHPNAGNSHLASSWSASADPYDCYYANKTPSWDAAGTADDPSLDRDDRTGQGPENIRINSPSTTHAYTIGVHMYNNIAGSVDATVKLYCGNVLMATERRVFSSVKTMWVVGRVQFNSNRTCTFTRDGYVLNKP
ncbi:MAG: MopE-related protein [Myxococcales bacterium]|jgi:hypothetical protein